MERTIFKGNIIFTPDKDHFEIHENSYIVVEDGKVQKIVDTLGSEHMGIPVIDFGDKLIIPGYTDLHLHAPQYRNKGLGYDMELLDWLNTYTFKEEERFSDIEYAKKVYKAFFRELLQEGTLNAVMFSSIHKEATELLFEMSHETGIRAFIGKVNMDRNTTEKLKENTQQSIQETEELILKYKSKYPDVKPIITPRFVPTCSNELLKGLGELAAKYDIPVQSHINENYGEIKWVKELEPDSLNYADAYNRFGLFGQTKTIMAHCVYNEENEVMLLEDHGVFSAHCPDSNANIASGIMPLRSFLNKGMKVGLGTDISGGETLSIRQTMVSTIKASKYKWLESGKELTPLSSSEALYLATKGGGEFFGNTGSFEEGYFFDALVIDDEDLGIKEEYSLKERIERYLYLGSYRNIEHRIMKGKELKVPD